MNVKRLHMQELERQRYFALAREYCSNLTSLNAQAGRGFEAAEAGWSRKACPYRSAVLRGFWRYGYRVGLAALELGLIPRSIQA